MADEPEGSGDKVTGDGENKWAGWKEKKASSSPDPNHSGSNNDAPSLEDKTDYDTKEPRGLTNSRRGRGYQEKRRYDRDRRDSRKKGDKKSDDPSEPEAAASEARTQDPPPKASEQPKESESKTPVKSGKSYSSTGGRGGGAVGRPSSGDSSRWKSEPRGPKKTPEQTGKDRKRAPGEKGRTEESGAELLTMLHQSKDGKTSDNQRSSSSKTKPTKELRKGKSAAELEAQWQKEEQEKKKKEEEEKQKIEEEKRKEEEKIRQEEEQKRREEEEARRLLEEEIKNLNEFIDESREKIRWKDCLRDANLTAAENRLDESFFAKLDSSLKKNSAFVKKLRYLTESQKDSLTKDFMGLNLSKYIGEAAVALTEAKLKMADVTCAVHLSSLLHQRYPEFSVTLLENWNKVLLSKKDDKVHNPSKLRVDLRFFADLIAVGVWGQRVGLPLLANQLTLLTANDKDDHNNLTIILSFCKHCGDDYAGLLSEKYRLLAEKYNREILRSSFLPAERQKACRNLLRDYFSSLCKHLEKEHRDLRYLEKQNMKILQTRGELSVEKKERQEAAVQAFQKLYSNAMIFADLFNASLPELSEEEFKTDNDVMGCDIFQPLKAEYEYCGDSTLFEDEDTRQFYENIPDLKSVIPGILYKDSEQTAAQVTDIHDSAIDDDLEMLDVEELERALSLQMESEEAMKSIDTPMEEEETMKTADTPGKDEAMKTADTPTKDEAVKTADTPVKEAHKTADTPVKEAHKTADTPVKEKAMKTADTPGKKAEKSSAEKMIEDELAAATEDVEQEIALDVEDEDTDIASSMKLVLEAFLNSLPNCVNREIIDRAATDFCMNLNTKSNRKKLVKALFTVQRTRYDLLPFYSRLVATLHPCMPDVATDLGTSLKGDFRWHVRKKDQINIESKLKTVRFIGELVKFNMFPKSEALYFLKMLMFDFAHHNIEMACSLLETCGRFLYRSPDSHHRTKVYLDVMMRKKAAFHFDQRYTTMIENAYYYSNPPDIKQEAKKIRPPMHEYIRKLLYKDLAKTTTEKILRQIRKLSWDDPDVRFYGSKCLAAVGNVKYNCIHCCANLLAGLASYNEDIAIGVVDTVLEDIRLGMEVNHPKFNQRRVSCVKYIGELYNYRMVESGVVFKTLYSFITFGVSMDEMAPTLLDPPEHLFRIRLVCVLLDTCGQYFDRGSSKKKLDYFLAYFQKYYWFKQKHPVWCHNHPFPMDVVYMYYDTVEAVRPKLKLHTNYDDTVTALEELEKDLLSKIAEILPKPERVRGDSEQDYGLLPIQEADETDDLSQVQMTDDTIDSDTEREGTGSQSLSRQVHREDEGEEGEEPMQEVGASDTDDLMESAGEEEMDDQVTILTGGLKPVKCQEDEDFMAAFDNMLSETIQARNQEALKLAQVEITVPMHLKAQQKPKIPAVGFLGLMSGEKEKEEEEEEEEVDTNSKSIRFTLMTKKGNKPQFAALNIPVSEDFASRFRKRTEDVKAEKERMKRVVLDFHERQEEEDYQEMIASLSRPAMVNLNREKKVRYQHPKGAPDADLIFGSKS